MFKILLTEPFILRYAPYSSLLSESAVIFDAVMPSSNALEKNRHVSDFASSFILHDKLVLSQSWIDLIFHFDRSITSENITRPSISYSILLSDSAP